jgi:transcriptional regulator with XRE-family HTH domain
MMPVANVAGRCRPQDIDRCVGARVRERRIVLGLTQQQMTELIGMTYQQAHKYEKRINRVASGRLYCIAQALGVEVGYFYESLQTAGGLMPSPKRRMLLDLARKSAATLGGAVSLLETSVDSADRARLGRPRQRGIPGHVVRAKETLTATTRRYASPGSKGYAVTARPSTAGHGPQ